MALIETMAGNCCYGSEQRIQTEADLGRTGQFVGALKESE